ncbi:hypothetical protein ACF06X_26750 [Streptomyces sp. NPDC015346]|uniref:hypothetical protein n=1 Tax=Streptomyces sp. NPDC015346 TaxID=3364954 RepID=UPI0036F74D91
MNEGGRFHRQHLLAEARRHLALVLRGRRREPGPDDWIMAAAISTQCLDISEPKTVRGLESGYRLYTARWDLSDLPPDATHQPPPPARTGNPRPSPASRLRSGPGARTRGSGRCPAFRCSTSERSSPVREQPRTTTGAVRGRAYDVVAHEQAAMPEQLLGAAAVDPEHDDQEPEAEPREAID